MGSGGFAFGGALVEDGTRRLCSLYMEMIGPDIGLSQALCVRWRRYKSYR